MRFNYGLEKKKFDERWRKLYQEYIQAGWDTESIQKMYEYDYAEFKRERVFCKHNQYLNEISREVVTVDGDCFCELFEKIENLYSEMPENPDDSRYGWLQEIEDKELYKILCSLPIESLELITQLAIDGLRQVDIAMQSGVSRAAVAKRVSKLRKKLAILARKG